MTWGSREPQRPATAREAVGRLSVADLKALSLEVGLRNKGRKDELVDALVPWLTDPVKARKLFDRLDTTARHAVRHAAHSDDGKIDIEYVETRYGGTVKFGGESWQSKAPHSVLWLFFPDREVMPAEVQMVVRRFVEPPGPPTLADAAEAQATHRIPYGPDGKPADVAVTTHTTERAALADLQSVLRLVESGGLKVSDKTQRPGKAGMDAVARVLSEGDFYSGYTPDPDDADFVPDLAVRAYAWPVIVQAASLARPGAGGKLELTDAGRRSLGRPVQQILREVWKAWLKGTEFDEFERVHAIRGLAKAGPTSLPKRRDAVVNALEKLPAGRWVEADKFLKQLRLAERSFTVARNVWDLYISESGYGSLGYDDKNTWLQVQGRYTLAFLFEAAAVLGLIDVAHVPPVGARDDFRARWGTDDLLCLSRYDGLVSLRVNPLGAYCLGKAESYKPEREPARHVLRVLANLDVVAVAPPLSSADALVLERYAERKSEDVWHLDRVRILGSAESGLGVDRLREFLLTRCAEALPAAAERFLDDAAARASDLRDRGLMRVVACRDGATALLLASDRKLKGLVELAGGSTLLFSASDEPAVRRAFKALGYILPPPA